ncbi:fasciclin domain-containing protein [Sphingomonas albertensis]|uniref:Fasciclin domain-containing protein n=1 Tax=Sphingomonas albertensis TaxID=2762591 RepID=A0ABR7AKP0_9SPHN|nr:fasciclin domain-containing protein [Sphingomonas albertensis]MBC3941015.1 fasciclin domain-containing protein [Sphingomonas albertensis]
MTVKTNLLIAAASSMIFAAGATAQTAPVETTATQTTTSATPAQTAPATTATPQAAPATAAPVAPTAAPTTTIAAALPTLPNRATLTKLVTAAKLQTTLAGPGPFTVFAPSDEAFTRLPAGALDTLLKPESAPTLATIIKYHVVAGAVTSDQLKAQITAGGGKATLTTLAGQPLIASLGPNSNIELTDTAGIKSYVDTADIKETNGVVHLTNGMSVPKLG